MLRQKMKSFGFLLVGIIVICSSVGLFLFSPADPVTKLRNSLPLSLEKRNPFSKTNDYAFETCYVGNPVLPDVLFDLPFKRSDSYVCNKDLIKKYGTENLTILADKNKEDLSNLFNVAYKDLIGDQEYTDIFWNGFGFSNANKTIIGNNQAIDLIRSEYISSKTSLESDVYTDKCMVFYDENSYIVRSALYITPYECDDLIQLAALLKQDEISLGTTYRILVETSYVTIADGTDFSDFSIREIRLI